MDMQGFAAILASLGFAILFNIRGDKLFAAALIGGCGGISYYMSMELGCSQVLALFIASCLISILSEVFARILKCPATTFLICALIPLVPGGGMYYTMLALVRDNIDAAINAGVDTIVQAGSIVIGCTFVSSAMKMMNQYKFRKQAKQIK